MKTLTSIEDITHITNTSPALLLYFYNDSCAPCVALRPKIEQMLDNQFAKMHMVYVNSAQSPELSALYNVFASPAVIVYFDGHETFRVSKYISINELAMRIERYYNLMFE